MLKKFKGITKGYHRFRDKYVAGNNTLMRKLSEQGQQPEVMVVSCCDSRVDPALLLQCNPGDLFVVRNVANIIPPYENDEAHHGTSAALEFGVCYLNIKDLVILGHSQCAGIHTLISNEKLEQDDFISNWVNIIKVKERAMHDATVCAKDSLVNSYHNCLSFPWIKERVDQRRLTIHLWFFEIKEGMIYNYDYESKQFKPL